MRYSMLLGMITATLFLGNVLDLLFRHHNPAGISLLFAFIWLSCSILLLWHMFRTPDKNFVPLYRVKEHLPPEVYKELSKKGPFQ